MFPKWTNHIPTFVAAGAGVGVVLVVSFINYYFSPRFTDVGYAPEQPVQYSHKLHAGLLGFDCRYCHNTVEHAAHAAIPATQTCLNCHKEVKKDSPRLQMVRDSGATGEPIPWVKVHMLPDYAYFNHSVHTNIRGEGAIGCVSCHGRIDQMEVVRQDQPLNMGWCLECHREPEAHLRPREELTNMTYEHDSQWALEFKERGEVNPPQHCSACHR
ncbi:MAG: cytochrome c3 family protein [Planctomycetota bacterium]